MISRTRSRMAASKPSRSEPSWITSWPMLVFLTAYSSCARNLRLRDSGLFYSSLLRRIRLQIFYRNRDGTFDEIEKASDALWKLLLGILDKGTLTLGDNSRVDFSRCIIVMTSNLGAR